MIKLVAKSIAVLALAVLLYGADRATRHISVKSSPDPSGIFPTSKLYVAELTTADYG